MWYKNDIVVTNQVMIIVLYSILLLYFITSSIHKLYREMYGIVDDYIYFSA